MYKKLFTIIVWLTALTMLWTLPFGGLPTQPVQAAAPQQPSLASAALTSAPLPPVVPPAPPLDEPAADPLAAIRQLPEQEYLRLYRGQPAWPKPGETGPIPNAPSSALPASFPQVSQANLASLEDERAALDRRMEALALPPQPVLEPTGAASLPTAALLPPIPTPEPPAGWQDPAAAQPAAEPVVSSTLPARTEESATIQGRVTSAAGGSGLANVNVSFFDEGGMYVYAYAYTDADGYYSTEFYYAPSVVKVVFTPNDGTHVLEWYDNQPFYETATPVTIPAGETTTLNAVLEVGGSISGTVTNAVTGLPLNGAWVQVFLPATNTIVNGGSTNEAGSYQVNAIRAGSYQVRFVIDTAYGYNLVPEWYNNQLSQAGAALVSVASGVTTPGINAALEEGATINGTLTHALDGDPLENIYVRCATADTNETCGSDQTDTSGSYRIDSLLPGSYKLYYDSQGDMGSPGEYVDEWFHDKTDFNFADTLTVSLGQDLTGINNALSRYSTISGQVTDATTGAPVPNVIVNADGTIYGGYGWTTTQIDGTYTLNSLIPDSYRISFSPSSETNYQVSWYANKTSIDTADLVLVGVEQTVTGINQTLVEGGRISGTVTNAATGALLPNVYVYAYDFATGAYRSSAATNESGSYILGNLPAGQHKVYFVPDNWTYPDLTGEWYNNQPNEVDANPVTVTTGAITANINAALETAARITGRVTRASDGAPLQGVYVTAVTAESNSWMRQVMTDENGVYTLTGLAAGTWKVYFQGGADYIDQWYQDQLYFDTANVLTLTQGQTLSGIDAVLVQGGKISGTVTDAATHTPQENIFVSVFDPIAQSFPQSTYTGPDGTYTLSRLPAGQYQVRFEVSPWYTYPTPMTTEWYNNKRTLETADLVSVTQGATTANINAALEAGASLSGRVTRTANGAPISDVYVGCVNGNTGDWVGYNFTNAEGYYTIPNLPAGTYVLYFSHSDYVFEYYQDERNYSEADRLVVDFGDVLTGLNAQLDQGGRLSGKVTSEYNGAPLPDVNIMALDAAGVGRYGGTTDAEGNFLSDPLPAGAYRIRYYPEGSGFTAEHILEWYKDQPTQSTADYVQVQEGLTTGGLDAALTRGGIISGVVTDVDTGLPIENLEVQAYISGYDTRYSYTDSTGAYAIKGLPAGSARVTFYTHGTPYIPERYNDILYANGAYDPVPVTLNNETKNINASLKKGVRLSGSVVSDDDGLPLVDAYVSIYSDTGASWGGIWTDGTFTSMGLPDGKYYLRYYVYTSADWLNPRTKEHLSEWGPDAGIRENGEPVTVAYATSPAIVDLGAEGLALGSKISGTVTASGGAPLADVYVEACPLYFNNWSDCRSANSAADGSYTLTGLYPGRYSLLFDTANSSNETTRLYASERYQDFPYYAQGTELRLPAGTNLSGINAVLEPGGFIRGTVTASSTSAPLPDVEVDFFTPDGSYIGYTVTNLSGEYVSPALPAGDYTLLFFPYDSSGTYAPEWYNDKTSWDTADLVSLASGATVRNINAALSSSTVAAGGVLRGRVTAADTGLPLAGAFIDGWYVDSYNDWHNYFSTTADSNGYYEITLAANNYRVRFTPPGGSAYVMEWYDNRFTYAEAVPVLISGGSTFTANAALERGYTISGTLTDALTHLPVSNGTACYLDVNYDMVRCVGTNQNGQYTTEPLIPGTYYLVFYAYGYLDQYFDQKEWFEQYDPVTLTTANRSGVDAALEPAVLLAGRVSTINNSEPILAELYLGTGDDNAFHFENYSDLSSRGEYAAYVAPGDYPLYARPYEPYNQEYQGAYFDNVYSLAEATLLHLPAGTTKNKVWVELDDSGGRISGRTTNLIGDRAEFTSVYIYDAEGKQVAEAYADFYGYYTSPMLAPGSYRLLFVPWRISMDQTTWLPEYYNNRYSLETALPVTVVSGQDTPNINVSFADGNFQFTQPGDTQEEGSGLYGITVEIDAPSALDVSLSVSFGGTATQGADYIPKRSDIIIPAGETTGILRIELLEDSLYEVDETITLELWSNNFGLRGEQYTYLLTLEDNEPPVLLPAPQLSSVSPDQSRNHVPVELTLTGANFTPGSQVRLTSGSYSYFPAVTYLSSSQLKTLLPVGFTPGTYDLTVLNPDGQSVTLSAAYQSLSPIDSDLLGASYELWTSPTSVYEGTSVQLGQVVSRLGGATTLSSVNVRFYLGDPSAGGTLIGTGTVASLAPDSQASTTGIAWTTPAAGSYTLYAVIDPTDAVVEANETNNTLSRSVQVLPTPVEAPDLTPPVVVSFSANGGARSTSQPTINLSVSASDTAPGTVARVKFIEYVYNEGSGLWQEGQASSWMTYASTQAYPWTLLPGAGARYLQAWAADSAGNVSLLPLQTWINYLPAGASLLAGQSHYYLFELVSGAGFTITVTPSTGDPDLYVFAPDFATRLPWVSISSSLPDWVSFAAPLSGTYVARVYGYTDAAYTLTYTAGVSGKPPAAESVLLTKELLTEPGLEPEEVPSDQRSVDVPVAVQFTFQLFLPLVRE
jgi:hypothetical protein